VLRHAADVVKTRTVPPEVVAYWVDKIATLEPTVSAVQDDEKEEKAIRVAEMEANKASNLIQHREEILARPPRSWFQSETARADSKEAARLQAPTATRANAQPEAMPDRSWVEVGKAEEKRKQLKRDRFAGMPRKKRRAIQRDEAFASAVGEGEDGDAPAFKLPNQKALARAAKTEARGKPLQLGKRMVPGGSGGDKGGGKRAKKEEGPTGLQAAAASAAREKRPPAREKTIPKKVKSKSKSKFAKQRRR